MPYAPGTALPTNKTDATAAAGDHAPAHNATATHVNAVEAHLAAAPQSAFALLVAASDSPAAWKAKADYQCDGTADENEITAALGALPQIGTPRYGTVRLAPGTFNLGATVTVKSFQTVEGSGWGTMLRPANATNIFALTLDDAAGPSSHCQGAAVRFLKIDGNSGNQTTDGGGIKIRGGNRCVVDHVSIVSPTHSGIKMEADGAGAWPWACELSSVMVVLGMNSPLAATAGYGLDLGDGEECEVHNCNLEFNGKSHIRENVVGNNSIHDNSFIEGSVGIESNGSRGRWIGNVFDSVKGHNLRITGNENLVVGNVMFLIGQGTTGTADGIALAFGASRNVIVGNRLSSHGTNGVTRYLINDQLDGGGNTHLNLISDNQLRVEGTLSGGVVSAYGGDNLYRSNVGGEPATQTVAAGTAIKAWPVTPLTATGSTTMTAAPTIASGVDGQEAVLLNVGTNNIILQDQGTLASSNLRLTATTVTLGARDSIRLAYSAALGDWVQIGALVNVL